MVTLDVPHVFRVFRGPRGLLTVFDKHCRGHGLNYNQVQMWHHRGQIPSKFVVGLSYAVEQEGHKWAEFLTDTEEFS